MFQIPVRERLKEGKLSLILAAAITFLVLETDYDTPQPPFFILKGTIA
jgi:hypothetical protein